MVLLLAPAVAVGSSPSPERTPLIVQDSQTKIIYYLESDRRHVAAITPEGKLLWNCEVIPPPKNDFQRSFSIVSIGLSNAGIDVLVVDGGKGIGKIDKITGVYSPPDHFL